MPSTPTGGLHGSPQCPSRGSWASFAGLAGPDAVVMLMLPITVPWEAGAFVGGYEWGRSHTDLRTALLRRWHDRHGAELAANWGTILQLVVRHPPATIEEAWTVACEVSLMWPDTSVMISPSGDSTWSCVVVPFSQTAASSTAAPEARNGARNGFVP